MHIRCRTVEQFVAHLDDAEVEDGVVYVDCYETPLNGTKYDAVSFDLFFAAYAVLVASSGEGVLLECECDCGIDRRTGDDGERNGTVEQQRLIKKLEAYCSKTGLKIKPGAITE